MKILIGGDTVFNNEFLNVSKTNSVFGEELLNCFRSADYRIINFESPITDCISPIIKTGPNLYSPSESIEFLQKLNIDLCSLSNNHIMDQDQQGLFSTFESLEENNIDFVGAGNNLVSASKPYRFCLEDKTICVYSCCEHEFSVAGSDKPGANPFDPLESLDHIQEAKKNCDILICLYHGGKEHYQYPSPYLQKVCRKIAEKGADLVVCQHSHCVGCMENYKSSKIIYGQGNFCFFLDDRNTDLWNKALLITYDTESGDVDFVPVETNNNTVNLSGDSKIYQSFLERSKEIQFQGFVERKFCEYSERNIDEYLKIIRCLYNTKFLDRLNRLTLGRLEREIDVCYDTKYYLHILNYLQCEVHNEMICEGIKNKYLHENEKVE